jgi:hypothetical protein
MIATDYFIFAIIAIIAAYDVWLCRDGRPNNTISHRVSLAARHHPWLTLVILIFTILLAGHWFLDESYWWPWRQPIFVKD